MKPLINIVQLENWPIFQQLQLEEALLRTDESNWCILNQGGPPTIVMGISGDVHTLINPQAMRQAALPIIRRFSGGGTVVTDTNTLFITFICNSTALNISPFPRPIMQWTAELYRPLFSDAFALRENDYVMGEKKWGGNAQSIVKNRWLHHSSLLWDYDKNLMDYLLLPSKAPLYRNHREHQDFLCCLSDFWQSPEKLTFHLILQIEHFFSVQHRKQEDLKKFAFPSHRQATTFVDYSYI